MKAGDVIAMSDGFPVKLATASTWSHVALAINDKEVIEAIPDGVFVRDLDISISSAKKVILFSRKEKLTDKQADDLKLQVEKYGDGKHRYGRRRAGYAGLYHIVRNAIYCLTLLWIGLGLFFKITFDDNYSLMVFLVFILVGHLVVIPLAKFGSNTKYINKLVTRNGWGNWLKVCDSHVFCSQIVCDIDSAIGGELTSILNKQHELRPKDVVKACRKLQLDKRTL